MTEIKGSYLYDLKTGQTIGRKQTQICLEEKKDYSETRLYSQEDRTYYCLLNTKEDCLYAYNNDELSAGTVKDLSFNQIISLFAQGNMTTDELQIGLQAKGAENINISDANGVTTATFTFENRNYTLKCATDAAASQIDDVQSAVTDDSISASFNNLHTDKFTPYTKKSGYDDPDDAGQVFVNDSDHRKYDVFEWDYKFLLPTINEYFGLNLTRSGDVLHLPEDIMQTINEHPEIFHITKLSEGSMSTDPSVWTEYQMNKGGYQMTADEFYSYKVTQWGNRLSETNTYDGPLLAVKCDGQNVEFTDKTVAAIKDYLSSKTNDKSNDGTTSDYMKLFGFTVDDDEETIWEKINFFCKSVGSTDGKTIALSDYYDLTANVKLTNNTDRSGYTYEKIAEMINDKNASYSEYIGSKKTTVTNQEDFSYAPSMDVGGVPVDVADDDDSTSKVNEFLDGLKQKYPEVYKEYYLQIQRTLEYDNQYDNPYQFDGKIRLDWYETCHGESDSRCAWYRDVLDLAAGITDSDSYSEQDVKRNNIVDKMCSEIGGEVTDGYGNPTLSVVDMFNYLLGDNSEKVNYFDKLIQKQNSYSESVIKALDNLEVAEPNPDIKVDRSNGDYHSINDPVNSWEHYGVEQLTKDEREEKLSHINDIKSYIKELLDPIYENYFADDRYDSYINFEKGKSDYANSDSDDFQCIVWSWRSEEMKQAFVKEVDEVIAKALAKYSNEINDIVFDGQRIMFTTIYDDVLEDNRGTEVYGNIYVPGYQDTRSPYRFEAAVDKTKAYTNPPEIIENNIPDGAPVNVDGNDVVKTPWDGIYVSANGDYLYLWDAKEQQYLEMKLGVPMASGLYSLGDTSTLPFYSSGDTKITNYSNAEVHQILLSLVYGYNRTDNPTIFEKDGKYYQLDYGTKYHREGLEGYKDTLREISFVNSSSQSEPTNSSTPETQAKTISPSTLEAEKVVNTETPDTPDTKTEEIVYKSEDVVSEMETAAEKLNLTAANTTGIYKQFSTQGSYLYIWDPQTKKFKAFSVNVRNADGTINQEFTQAGKAVNRTETNIYYEALLEAYKNGYNFTANYPWVCEKDGVYYEYDKEAGCFKKRAD